MDPPGFGRCSSTRSVRSAPVAPSGWLRIAELVAHYHDLPLGTVDSSVGAAAERLSIHDVATLDYRRFAVVRPTLGPFNLLP